MKSEERFDRAKVKQRFVNLYEAVEEKKIKLEDEI